MLASLLLLGLSPVLAVAASSSSASDRGTWTYYTTVTNTKTLRSTSETGTGVVYTSSPDIVVSTRTTFTKTVETEPPVVTATVTVTGTTTVTKYPKTSNIKTVAGFTPILSIFPYTASVKLQNVTKYLTTYKTTSYSTYVTYTNDATTVYKNAVTSTVTYTSQPVTTYVTIAKTSTSRLTATGTLVQYAACTPGSANFVDHFPFGNFFGPRLGGLDGSVHAVDTTDKNRAIYNVTNANDCCNACMATGLCAGGYWSPLSLLGRPNECQLYLVANSSTCAPAETKQTLLKGPFDQDNTDKYRGYFAFNGQCGQFPPDQHEVGYYQPQ